MVHWFAIGGTLGHGAFTASAAHTDTVDDVACKDKRMRTAARTLVCGIRLNWYSPCLALYPSLRALSGLVGRGARWRLDSWRYCQHRTRSRKRITSDCFLRHNSCIYLYAPMLTYLELRNILVNIIQTLHFVSTWTQSWQMYSNVIMSLTYFSTYIPKNWNACHSGNGHTCAPKWQ